MTWIAGVDGCPGGWFRVCRERSNDTLRFDLVGNVADLLDDPYPTIVAIDMPIGLPERGDRVCDREARKLLGPRRSSVFPVPPRSVLASRSYEAACRRAERVDGRRITRQAWHLLPKIRALDALLQASEDARSIFHEAHPELCFRAWNDGHAMSAPKRQADGRAQRRALVDAWLGAEVRGAARAASPRRELADDDILDAIAALWTANRIADGAACTLPSPPPQDQSGLPMRIVY